MYLLSWFAPLMWRELKGQFLGGEIESCGEVTEHRSMLVE